MAGEHEGWLEENGGGRRRIVELFKEEHEFF